MKEAIMLTQLGQAVITHECLGTLESMQQNNNDIITEMVMGVLQAVKYLTLSQQYHSGERNEKINKVIECLALTSETIESLKAPKP